MESKISSGHDDASSIPCCPWSKEGSGNSSACGPLMEKMHFGDYRGRKDWLVHDAGSACQCGPRGFDPFRFTWVPHGCALPPWNPEHFCDLLGNRTILLIGDSTVQQAASVLMNHVAFDSTSGGVSNRCQEQIIFASADTLTGHHFGAWNRGRPWHEAVELHKPHIVILGVGPHIYNSLHPNSTYHIRTLNSSLIYSSIVENVKSVFMARKHEFLLIWKTISGGGCSAKPLTTPLQPADWTEYKGKAYNYGFFEEWDGIARSAFSDVPHAYLLDMHPITLRSDAHISKEDCLHYCLPGPLSLFSTLLMNLLVEHNI